VIANAVAEYFGEPSRNYRQSMVGYNFRGLRLIFYERCSASWPAAVASLDCWGLKVTKKTFKNLKLFVVS